VRKIRTMKSDKCGESLTIMSNQAREKRSGKTFART
jgi:hypothetical protein